MKKYSLFLAITVMAALSLTLTSCYKSDYYDTTPTGYQQSFNDEFNSDNLGWYVNDPANGAYVNINNGLYKISFHANGGASYSNAKTIGYSPSRNFLIQTSIKSDNAMGLIFGGSNSSYGYSVFIDDTGYFAVYNEGNNNQAATKIIDWQYSNAIRSGWNDLELEQYNGYWTGYINGTKVFEIQAQYASGSQTGFIVLGNTTGYADYLTVKW